MVHRRSGQAVRPLSEDTPTFTLLDLRKVFQREGSADSSWSTLSTANSATSPGFVGEPPMVASTSLLPAQRTTLLLAVSRQLLNSPPNRAPYVQCPDAAQR